MAVALAAPLFCAVCTSARGPFTREAIGINDAVVNVCAKCTSEAVVPKDASAARRGLVRDADTDGMSRSERVRHMRAIGRWKR